MAARSSSTGPAARILVAMLAVFMLTAPRVAMSKKKLKISYYLQQDYGTSELQIVPAARPAVNGTNSGFGQSVVYEFVMTETADATSDIKGYVRGTAVSVNNTAAATIFFVTNVVHYDYGGVQGTLSQQGEAIFSAASWEFAVVGGTGAFRQARGYNVGSSVSVNFTASGGVSHFTTHYQAHFSLG